nr:carbamoyltransferase HypF [Collinsella urealyticum]
MRIHITGIVQGVGMRPFVYREACAHQISGWVLNAADGVHIEAAGRDDNLHAFIQALSAHAPAAARIEHIETHIVDAGEERDASAALYQGDHGTHEEEVTGAHPHAHVGSTQQPRRASTSEQDSPASSMPPRVNKGFTIRESEDAGAHTTLVSPDIAICNDCLKELFDPNDRRYHYPFITCTNCGPRFTIIRALPYDRLKTSMEDFDLCPVCAAEYTNPADRRFHAQPDACFVCGPHLSWREARGHSPAPAIGDTRLASDAIIDRAADLIAKGSIIAIKGLGGFHLACNAASTRAVHTLRTRKHRGDKPLAIMVQDLAAASQLAEINTLEQGLLTGTVRPIVLLKRKQVTCSSPRENAELSHGDASEHVRIAQPHYAREGSRLTNASEHTLIPASSAQKKSHTHGCTTQRDPIQISPEVAGTLPELGIMLPYTPLQYLLMEACAARGITALVMTSGNRSGDPIEIDDTSAWRNLVEGGLADALLGFNRQILTRFDDSVLRVVAGRALPIRRSRGYAPTPLPLPTYTACPSSTQAQQPDRAKTQCAGHALEQQPDRAKTQCAGHAQAQCAELHPHQPAHLCTHAAEQRPQPTSSLLATGSEQKATFALTRDTNCFLSQHIGDIDQGSTLNTWHETRLHMERLFDIAPTALACDLHPAYLTSRWARATAAERHLPLIEVQHHHAHIASVLAEARASGDEDASRQVLGIAFDGTGAGTDGTVWGGEMLIADFTGFSRAARLSPWKLLGGAGAILDPKKCAWSLLTCVNLLEHPGAERLRSAFTDKETRILQHMYEHNINSPLTSSMGRLLDGLSAILGICVKASYEGQPAIELEAAAWRSGKVAQTMSQRDQVRYQLEFRELTNSDLPQPVYEDAHGSQQESSPAARSCQRGNAPTWELNPTPLLAAALDDIAVKRPPEEIALCIHQAIIQGTVHAARCIAQATSLTTCALSGGVFMNRILLAGIADGLKSQGLHVLIPQQIPVNDGCIAYGQAAVAHAHLASPQ